MSQLRSLKIARVLRPPWSILVIILAILILTAPLLVSADAALTQGYTFEGNYGLVAGGAGLSSTGSGEILLNVPGTPVSAFLYWALHDVETGGDNTINLSINGAPSVTITADNSYGPDFWFGSDPARFHFVYSADVTSFILEGINNYTLSGVGPVILAYGAGLHVVYEDTTLPTNAIEIIEGLDSAHIGFPPPRGPHTEVSCIQFSPSGTVRSMDFSMFVAGIDVSGDLRPNALWYQTGSGATPTILVDQPGATEIGGQPFNSRDGQEWDTYQNAISIAAGDTFACFQIESIGDIPDQLGASMLWLGLGASLPVEMPTPTSTISPSDTPLPTPTDTPLPTPTNTATSDPTDTPLPTPTNTPPPDPTNTPTPEPTNPPAPTNPPSPTQTPIEFLQIPVTGFTPGRLSTLPHRPEAYAYRAYSDMTLYIPEISVQLPIVGIPLRDGEWDVTWLGKEAGYLEGTSFPTWSGNTVITSHVFLSDGTPGPFADLDQLQWGDTFIIEAFGQRYSYEVRGTKYTRPNDLSVFEHESLDWTTLITCSGYDQTSDTYLWRFVVQAVLVKIE